MSDTSHTSVLIYLSKKYPNYYSIFEDVGYQCGNKTFNNITVIVPPAETIEVIKNYIKKGNYTMASNLLKAHLLRKLYLTGSDFKKDEVVNWHLRTYKIKNVKDEKTVEIEDGTLTLDTEYRPVLNPGIGEDRNNTAVWVLKGVVKESAEPIKIVKSENNTGNKKREQKGGVDYEVMNTIHNDIAGFLKSNGRKNPAIYDHLAAIIDFLLPQTITTVVKKTTGGAIPEAESAEYINISDEIKASYIASMQELLTGYPEVDLLIVFCFKKLFNHEILSEIIIYQDSVGFYKNKTIYSRGIYIEFITNNCFMAQSSLQQLVLTNFSEDTGVIMEYRIMVTKLAEENILFINGVVLQENVFNPYLFSVLRNNPFSLARIFEIKYIYIRLNDYKLDTTLATKLFRTNYRDFGEGRETGLLHDSNVLGDPAFNTKFHAEAARTIFYRTDPGADESVYTIRATLNKLNNSGRQIAV